MQNVPGDLCFYVDLMIKSLTRNHGIFRRRFSPISRLHLHDALVHIMCRQSATRLAHLFPSAATPANIPTRRLILKDGTLPSTASCSRPITIATKACTLSSSTRQRFSKFRYVGIRPTRCSPIITIEGTSRCSTAQFFMTPCHIMLHFDGLLASANCVNMPLFIDFLAHCETARHCPSSLNSCTYHCACGFSPQLTRRNRKATNTMLLCICCVLLSSRSVPVFVSAAPGLLLDDALEAPKLQIHVNVPVSSAAA